jgi:hypothetical protein
MSKKQFSIEFPESPIVPNEAPLPQKVEEMLEEGEVIPHSDEDLPPEKLKPQLILGPEKHRAGKSKPKPRRFSPETERQIKRLREFLHRNDPPPKEGLFKAEKEKKE